MRPVLRAAVTAGAVLAAVVVGFGVRALNAYGVFTDVTPGFSGTCSAISGVSGPEDIAIDAQSHRAFVSALDRRAMAGGKPSAQDGLYVLSLEGTPHLTKLAGAPKDFHPHGISLVRDAAGLVLMAINHRSDHTSAIEIFDVAADGSLRQTGSITGGQLVSPNAIVALDRDRFYVANDHGSTTRLGRLLEDLFILPRANIVYFDGLVFRVVADHMAFASGLALSPDGNFLYATETVARRLDTFSRQPVSGALEEAGRLDIPSGLDNLRFDASGALWIGSHPKGLAMATFSGDPSRPAPSEIFKVTLSGGIPQSAVPVFTDDGRKIGGSSVAAIDGNRMLIGGPLTNHVLDCTMGR